ncbi:MAG: hypothetical protein HN566_00005, partial [Polaribacter sp.]|nr:hypothetical protein [Polaribacter sp.]
LKKEGKVARKLELLENSVIHELCNLDEMILEVNERKDEITLSNDVLTTELINSSSIKYLGKQNSDKLFQLVKESFFKFGLFFLSSTESKEFNNEDELGFLNEFAFSSNILISLLLFFKIKMIDESFSMIFRNFTEKNKWCITDDIDLLKKIISHLESSLTDKNQLHPFSCFDLFDYSISVSKETSDKYCLALIRMYVKKLKDLGCDYNPESLQEEFPSVFFNASVNRLSKHLLNEIDIVKGDLISVLNCEYKGKVYFRGASNRLIYFFKEKKLFKNNPDKKVIAKWIQSNFVQIKKDGKKQPLSFRLCEDVLTKKDKEPSIKNRVVAFI